MIPLVAGAPYLLDVAIVTESKIPVAGWREVVTRSRARVTFEQRDGQWYQTQRPCAVSVDGGRVRFPDGFVGSLPTQTFPIELGEDGRYLADPGPTSLGVRGIPDTLPKDADDPRVVDADGDGHPGATVHLDLPVLGKVDLQVVQAGHSRFRGQARAEGGVEGEVEILRLDQHTIGASVSLFASSPPVRILEGRSTFTIRPDPDDRCGR